MNMKILKFKKKIEKTRHEYNANAHIIVIGST